MQHPTGEQQATTGGRRELIEIGWLAGDDLDELDLRAIEQARQQVLERLNEWLPEFDWRLLLEVRESHEELTQREAVAALKWATQQRDLRSWDYVFVFVRPDLVSRRRPYAWSCISRSLDSVVISTARIDPLAERSTSPPEHRTAQIAHRVATLALRALGHLCGLSKVDETGNVMSDVDGLAELDGATNLTQEQLTELRETLRLISDSRLEEERSSRRLPAWRFYLHAAWRNRRELADGLRQARPWEMPFRLSGLTIAALTTMLVLVMTAEAWELGVHQPPGRVVAWSVLAICATTFYVLRRQALMLKKRRGLTEQIATTNLTTLAVISAGILTTYACLFLLTLLFSIAFFDASLVSSWSGVAPSEVSWAHYLLFAGFVSAAGIVIGAVGASFEGDHYFRHTVYVDEEV